MDPWLNIRPGMSRWLLVLSIICSFCMHSVNFSTDIQGVHVWRQSQTMWNVRNFVRHDANILNPRVSHLNVDHSTIHRYEFPLMQWSIAMLQKLFGEHIEVARIFIFLIGALSVVGMFQLLSALSFPPFIALIGAILFQWSPVFYYYTINPIPDNLALCGGIWYLFFMVKFEQTNHRTILVGASICLLLATLAKLPFLMFSIVSIYFGLRWWLNADRKLNEFFWFSGIQCIFLVPALAWYVWVIPGWEGNGILTGIFQHSIHWKEAIRILGFHVTEMFPLKLLNPLNSIPFVLGLVGISSVIKEHRWLAPLIGITVLYLVLQLNMIGTDHDYYMMPFLPWLYITATAGFYKLYTHRFRLKKTLLIGILIGSPIFTFFYTYNFWDVERSYINEDVFHYDDQLKHAVPDTARCIILNDPSNHIFSYQIDKKGFVFADDHLPPAWIRDMIVNEDVAYMYSDSRKVDEDPGIKAYIDHLILDAGSVHVFELKDMNELPEQ